MFNSTVQDKLMSKESHPNIEVNLIQSESLIMAKQLKEQILKDL